MRHQPFEPISLEPKSLPHGTFWIGAPREGFTDFCAQMLNVPIPVEDVTAGEALLILRRRDVLATLVGMQQAKSNSAVRSVEVVRARW